MVQLMDGQSAKKEGAPNGHSAPHSQVSRVATASLSGGLASNKDTQSKVKSLVKKGGDSRTLDLFGATDSDSPLSLTRREEKFVNSCVEISTNAPSGDDMAFFHAIMCQVGLPRRSVTGTEFERVCGGVALNVNAGKLWDGKKFVQQPIPSGAMPRLVLAWWNTYAVRNRTPEVPVGDSASEFMRTLGLSPGGGKRGSYTTFRKQVQALAACHMYLGFNANGRAYTYHGQPVKQFEAWLNSHEGQRPLWPASVVFSDDYYKTLCEHAVPLDMRAIVALKGSALALDLYTMFADRLHRISGRPLVLHWKSLREQFGQEYQGKNAAKDFKTAFLIALRDVQIAYPTAKIKQVTGGLLLMPSPPPIPYKG